MALYTIFPCSDILTSSMFRCTSPSLEYTMWSSSRFGHFTNCSWRQTSPYILQPSSIYRKVKQLYNSQKFSFLSCLGPELASCWGHLGVIVVGLNAEWDKFVTNSWPKAVEETVKSSVLHTSLMQVLTSVQNNTFQMFRYIFSS